MDYQFPSPFTVENTYAQVGDGSVNFFNLLAVAFILLLFIYMDVELSDFLQGSYDVRSIYVLLAGIF